jgi:5-methylcytosine-specific restriction endonuclease McrA
MRKINETSKLHLSACKNYRQKFLDENDYLYCENCGVNGNATPKFETHHIVFASEAPNHPELHNDRNLALLCINCHNKMHGNKITRNNFVKKRGLEDLFGRKLLR